MGSQSVRIIIQMKENDDIVPDFGGKSRENPFQVPDGYFESFTDRLQERIADAAPQEKQPIGVLRPKLIYILGLFLILLVSYPVYRMVTGHSRNNLKNEQNLAGLAEYSLENIDESTLIEALPDEKIEPPQAISISREELLRYIEDENIDPASITDQL